MTELRQAAEQALKVLEEINKLSVGEKAICLPAEIDGAMEALRQALAQPEQEPVAWIEKDKDYLAVSADPFENAIPVYTAPPKKDWVGLTDDDIWEAFKQYDTMQYVAFSKAIEAKLREKNS